MKNLQLDCMARNPTLQIFSISTIVLTNVVGNSLHCEANCIETGTKTNLPLIARKQRGFFSCHKSFGVYNLQSKMTHLSAEEENAHQM